jgi:hypothetical protein
MIEIPNVTLGFTDACIYCGSNWRDMITLPYNEKEKRN